MWMVCRHRVNKPPPLPHELTECRKPEHMMSEFAPLICRSYFPYFGIFSLLSCVIFLYHMLLSFRLIGAPFSLFSHQEWWKFFFFFGNQVVTCSFTQGLFSTLHNLELYFYHLCFVISHYFAR